MHPILVSFGDLQIFSYPLFMGIAWGIGFHLSRHLVNIPEKLFNLLFWGSFISSWIGAKAFFLITDHGSAHLTETSFWLGGGFVFYGGLIGGLLYLILFSYFNKSVEFKKLGVLFIPIAFSQGIGRIGCFLAGCCFGSDSNIPWAVHLHDKFRHPVQLYEALGLFILGMVMWKSSKNNLFPLYLFGYGILRFVLEFFRGDKIRGITTLGLSYSQLVSLALIITGLIILLWKKIRPLKVPLP